MSYAGECGRCGRCCTATVLDTQLGMLEFRCQNLLQAEEIGKAGATLCAAHQEKWTGMPITMTLVGAPWVTFPSRCLSEYPRAQDAVPPECTYKWDSEQPQPNWHLTYSPRLVEIWQK